LGFNFLWADLEAGGDGDIAYYPCADYVPSYWLVATEDVTCPPKTVPA
jgi:hypothetical protein